ncbi:DUF6714 family protein [Phyllobacterium sp. SB3]|uniref:DUF6714 family protein n=1 Tax=Phyllobacterium sp. SB3 TaxID=3156073 RepID=UPI0032AF15EE
MSDDLHEALINEIKAAFAGVTLGEGMSLIEAAYVDSRGKSVRGKPVSKQELQKLKRLENVDDWISLTIEELDQDNIAHLDAAGFRYYLPALMLAVISDYDPGSMRVIGTLHGLYPRSIAPYDWSELLGKYSLLNNEQKAATAGFLVTLPHLVELSHEDEKIVERAFNRYWSAFLPENKPETRVRQHQPPP